MSSQNPRTPRTVATGRPVGRPPKAPELRDRSSGRPVVVAFDAPGLSAATRRRVASLAGTQTLAAAVRTAIPAAPWLLAADVVAVTLLRMVAEALDADHTPANLARLAPVAVGLMTDTGLTAGARARLNIEAAYETPARTNKFTPPSLRG